MKTLFIGLLALGSLSALAEDIVCRVQLIESGTSKVLSQRELRQNTSGMSVGTIAGSDFYIEASKRKVLRKSIPISVISFSDAMDGWDNSTKVQFFRSTEPNRYDILTKHVAIGNEIKAFPGDHIQEKLDNKYFADIDCNLQESLPWQL